MNLVKALMGLGKGAANATGLPYLINTDIINPVKSLSAHFTGNEIAYKNANKAQDKELQLKKFLPNAAAALTLPFALESAAGKIWKPPTGMLETGARMGPNARYTLADFADYKMGRYKPNPKDLPQLAKDGWELGKKYGVDVTSGSPREIDMRIAELLDRFNGL